MTYSIPDMECGGCARAVTAAVREADPQARLDLDIEGRRATIESARIDAVLAALAAAGFPAARA